MLIVQQFMIANYNKRNHFSYLRFFLPILCNQFLNISFYALCYENIMSRHNNQIQMSSKKNKYALLDKNDADQGQMIEMVQINPKIKYDDASQQVNNVDYVRLQDQAPKTNNMTKVSQQRSQNPYATQNQPSNRPPQKNPQRSQPNPIYPKQKTFNQSYSANPNPTRIQMNGSNFRMQGAPEQKKAKLPQMKVACEHCTFEQNVPGNTQVYVCCCCNNMNECFPLYGLFICGCCQGKVCYPYGTSDMIRCTRCGTVNRVPTQPQKRYVSKTQKKEKKQEKKLINFEEQDHVVLEEAVEPERPVQQKKIQQQQISFDDIESISKTQQKQLNYPQIKE